jgi:predicted DNA binding CopG/RHH family protein
MKKWHIKKTLRELLENAREKRDKRFNFFISPKLLEFLENTSNTEGVTKSKYIRNLIVEHMRENKVSSE